MRPTVGCVGSALGLGSGVGFGVAVGDGSGIALLEGIGDDAGDSTQTSGTGLSLPNR